MSILHTIVAANAEELSAAKRTVPANELLRKIAGLPAAPGFTEALRAKKTAVIAELKKRLALQGRNP